MANPLLDDRTVDYLLYDVLDVGSLAALPYFADHSRETFAPYMDACRRLARTEMFPAYRALDEAPPRLEGGRVVTHPALGPLYARLAELGLLAATRPAEVGGQQLPTVVAGLAHAYLMAGNLAAYGYAGLTASAARLLESFATPVLRETYMGRMLSGEWTGTMALTEPQAGSSLADVKTRATPAADGSYRISGSKMFISGGDNSFTDNVIHLALARVDGAPPGVKGISLFVVPARRPTAGGLVANDIAVAGVIHKIGWKGIASLGLNFGERGDCHGWLVGSEHRGLAHMFQMMNEARLMVGLNGVATASVAYLESLEYARTRPQGRPASARHPDSPQVPIIQHADVRRMLLRQKAIVEGGLALLAVASLAADLAEHSEDEATRRENALLLDLLTPVAKSFPAERGYESNTLAVQIHGGYGYSSEYLVEAWLRDQKLNSLHEGTTGIHGIDLVGRKLALDGGAALDVLGRRVERTLRAAREAAVEAELIDSVAAALREVRELAGFLGGLPGAEARLRHSTDALDLFGTAVVGWLWLEMARVSTLALARPGAGDVAFHRGKLAAARYFARTELPRVARLAALCRSGEDSFASVDPESL
ncbi:MAG: acyl-CoA dehydrogenase [Deltaproteobacteria bacterium]|nr:acyl-CoA dehydrogenase [Deltaproteobacteria bacterium]